MVDEGARFDYNQKSTEPIKSVSMKENGDGQVLNQDEKIDQLIKEVNEIKAMAYTFCAKHAEVVSDYALLGKKAEVLHRKLNQLKS